MKTKKESLYFYEMIREYLCQYLPKIRNLSECSIEAERRVLNLLIDYSYNEQGLKMNEISLERIGTIQFITDFLNWIQNARHCSDATRNHRLSCVRSFFKFVSFSNPIYMAQYQHLQKIPLKKLPKKTVIEFMMEESVQALLNAPNLTTLKGLRDATFMTLLYDSAARNNELLSLKVRDVVHCDKPYIMIYGKGRKHRNVPIMNKTLQLIEKYMKHFHSEAPTSEVLLFYTTHQGTNNKMSPDTVAKFIHKYSDIIRKSTINLPQNVHPHMFRRSRAMHLYRNGMPLALLAEFLGHSNPETTLIYATSDTEMKRKAIEAASKGVRLDIKFEETIDWKNDKEVIKRLYGLKG